MGIFRTSIIFLLMLSLLLSGCGVETVGEEPAVPAIGSEINKPEEPLVENVEAPKPVQVRIQGVGDIMMHMPQIKSGYIGGGRYDFSQVYKYVRPIFDTGDLVIGNLETTFGGADKGYSGYPMFNAPDELAFNLREAGFDLIVTANNHSLDTGSKGLRRTIEVLDSAGLAHTGTFATEDTAPLIREVKGVRIGIVNHTYGTNGLKPPQGQEYIVNTFKIDKFKADISFLKEAKVDYILAYFHFGPEYQRMPDKTQREWVSLAFQEGVDLVLGAHPHVLQPFQVITRGEKDKVVAYSLGNFVSNQRDQYRDTGVIFQIDIEKDPVSNQVKLLGVNPIPTWVYKYHRDEKWNYTILPLGEDYWPQYEGLLGEEAFTRAKAAYEEAKEILYKPIEE